MTTNANAPVEKRHEIAAASAAGYDQPELVIRSITNGFCTIGEPVKASIFAHAESLANLEAANTRLAEIDRIAVENCWAGLSSSHDAVAALASGYTPSPCPGCTAKDEAMAGQLGALIQTQIMLDNMVHHKSVCWSEVHDRIIANRKVLPKAPPADPVAEALKAAMLEAWPAYVRDHAESDCQREAEAIAKALDKQGHTIIAKSRLPLGGVK